MGTAWKGGPRGAEAGSGSRTCPADCCPHPYPPSLGGGGPAHAAGSVQTQSPVLTVVSEGGLPLSTDAFPRLF